MNLARLKAKSKCDPCPKWWRKKKKTHALAYEIKIKTVQITNRKAFWQMHCEPPSHFSMLVKCKAGVKCSYYRATVWCQLLLDCGSWLHLSAFLPIWCLSPNLCLFLTSWLVSSTHLNRSVTRYDTTILLLLAKVVINMTSCI